MRDRLAVEIARVQAKTDVAAALGTARGVGDAITRAWALQAVVMVQARAAGVAAALQTVAGITEEPSKSAALVGVARVQTEQGDGAGAWTTLGGVADGILRSAAQKSIALMLARAGDPTRLIETARRASDVASRVMALAAAAEDVMRSANELQKQGGSIFLAPESGLL